MVSPLSRYGDFVQQLAAASAEKVMPFFMNPDLQVDVKQDNSPVTKADRAAELCLREMIEKRYPEHGIVGEEFGNLRSDAEFVWVLDPIDGTFSFANGCHLFGTLIALLRDGEPLIGAIHMPALGKLMIGDGQQTLLDGRPVRVRQTAQLEQALLLTTDQQSVSKYREVAGFDKLVATVNRVRTWGDCYGYFLLAGGWGDLMIDPKMSPWDLMALIPVVRGAGGVITDWYGGNPARGDSIVAGSPALHPLAIEILGAG